MTQINIGVLVKTSNSVFMVYFLFIILQELMYLSQLFLKWCTLQTMLLSIILVWSFSNDITFRTWSLFTSHLVQYHCLLYHLFPLQGLLLVITCIPFTRNEHLESNGAYHTSHRFASWEWIFLPLLFQMSCLSKHNTCHQDSLSNQRNYNLYCLFFFMYY